jgi:hypothetical protein
LELRREGGRSPGPRYPDNALFKWLSKTFEHGRRELTKLVEEQDSAVCEAYFSGPKPSCTSSN